MPPGFSFYYINMKKVIFSTLLTFLLSSCGLLITQKLILGVRSPKVQTTTKIQNFLKKNNSIDSTLTLTKKSFIHKISQSSNYFSKWELFDKNGYKLIPIDSNVKSCNGYTHSFFKNLPNSKYSVDTSNCIFLDSTIIKHLTLLNRTQAEIEKSEKFDYYLVIYWSTFMGKYSSDLFNLEKIAQNNTNTLISTIKINMDFKDYYGFTNKEINIEQKVEK